MFQRPWNFMNYRNTRESRQNLNLVEGMMKSGKSREKKTIVIVLVLSQKVYISWSPLAYKAAT